MKRIKVLFKKPKRKLRHFFPIHLWKMTKRWIFNEALKHHIWDQRLFKNVSVLHIIWEKVLSNQCKLHFFKDVNILARVQFEGKNYQFWAYQNYNSRKQMSLSAVQLSDALTYTELKRKLKKVIWIRMDNSLIWQWCKNDKAHFILDPREITLSLLWRKKTNIYFIINEYTCMHHGWWPVYFFPNVVEKKH